MFLTVIGLEFGIILSSFPGLNDFKWFLQLYLLILVIRNQFICQILYYFVFFARQLLKCLAIYWRFLYFKDFRFIMRYYRLFLGFWLLVLFLEIFTNFGLNLLYLCLKMWFLVVLIQIKFNDFSKNSKDFKNFKKFLKNSKISKKFKNFKKIKKIKIKKKNQKFQNFQIFLPVFPDKTPQFP